MYEVTAVALTFSGLLMFFVFCVQLCIRTFEIFIYGVFGFVLSAPAKIKDGGIRFATYNQVMLTKLFNAFLCFAGYLIIINILPSLLNYVEKINLETKFTPSNIFKTIIEGTLIMSSFLMLKSLSTE